MSKHIIYLLSCFFLLSSVNVCAQTARVYRPDMTSQNIPPAPLVSDITFTIEPEWVDSVRVIDKKIHLKLNREGIERFYFITARHIGKKLTINVPGDHILVEGPIKSAIETGYIISEPFTRSVDAVKVAKILQPIPLHDKKAY